MIAVCLHNVIAGPVDEFDRKCSRISAREFSEFLELCAVRYRLIPFSEFLSRLDEGRHDPGAVALTFDDGFSGVFTYAYPLLRQRGLDAGIFVNPPHLVESEPPIFHFLELELAFRLTKVLSARLEFLEEALDLSTVKAKIKAMKQVKRLLKATPEAERARCHEQTLRALRIPAQAIARQGALDLERYGVMGRAEVLRLQAAGWPVGSHTLTHRSLSWLNPDEARREIAQAKAMLEDVLGRDGTTFAYPYGEPVHIGELAPQLCAEAGHRYAFTTIPGDIKAEDDPRLLKRVDYKEFRADYLT